MNLTKQGLDRLSKSTFNTPENIRADQDARHQKEQDRQEALALVLSYAQDVVDFWPLMTLRTIRVMIPKMAALKEALEMLRGQDRS